MTSIANQSVDFGMKIVQLVEDTDLDGSVVFNGLAMASISLLVGWMGEQGIPITAENFGTRLAKFQVTIQQAALTVVSNSELFKGETE